MQTEPDVLTEHNELILSTNIERVVTGRDTALKRIEQLIQQLDAISGLTSGIGGGTAQDWAMKAGHRYDIRDNPAKDVYEDEFFRIRYYQKGTAHLAFKRLELIERMNDIIAKHFPGMLASR
ncbi:DUF4942 domain-containing protein [Enterobacter mori]|uniref:DUF4942 domain-containing protein n=1 Tax=Enterobacter mori TaxID=539813 RepID=UPI001BFCB535|nr:DUF4942 domain-containing protein [Enterobacter mori]QWC67506.1 DUF4942 domain-containing protein [Enterobacter mori]